MGAAIHSPQLNVRTSAVPTASTITIAETIQLLEGRFSDFADGFSKGMYALWLGSAISRERVVGLDGVLSKLLERLRQRIINHVDCPHYTAMLHILHLADLSPEQISDIDFGEPVSDWSNLESIIDRLWNKYSKVLGVEVNGHDNLDYILWDVIDFKVTFSSQDADAEHLAIGMLVLEGVVSELATSNWDALLEAAVDELGYKSGLYSVAVKGDDLKGPVSVAKLYKFHGCALRAIEDEPNYRSLIVAREGAVNQWAQNPAFDQMRVQLCALLQRAHTLMVGMSAQDPNIQALFGNKGWKWNDVPTPIIFATDQVGDGQKIVLEGAYLADYEANRTAIWDQASFPAYGKALFLALLLVVISKKLELIASKVDSAGLDAAAKQQLVEGIRTLRDGVATAGNADRYGLARMIARSIGRFSEQFFGGKSEPGVRPYIPIHSKAPHLMALDQMLQHTGQPQAVAALGVIGLEVQDGKWSVKLDDPTAQTSGALHIVGVAEARVFFASNDERINGLMNAGAFAPGDGDVVVICSGTITERKQRSPRGSLRDGRLEPRLVGMADVLKVCTSLGDFRQRFRAEVGL